MTRPAIFVAGLGRCGSSLTMQMLDAGGVSVLGRWPAYECMETHRVGSADWLRGAAPGRAVKLIDPHRFMPPREMPALVVWLDRDVRQQADSIAKFNEVMSGIPRSGRAERRAMASKLGRDRARALAALDGQDRRRLILKFEHLVEEPVRAALDIANFLRVYDGPTMSVARAAAVVVPRSGACFPGMLEAEILERGRAAA